MRSKNFVRKLLAVCAVTGLTVNQAMAALPAGVSGAITDGGADGGALMGMLAGAGAALYIIWKILKKAGIML